MADIKKHLPAPLLNPREGVLPALIEALGEADLSFEELIIEARKQLFIPTAEGDYLRALTSESGFSVDPDIGLDSKGIRKIAIPAIHYPKQIEYTVKELASAFYTRTALNPYLISEQAEPFSLIDLDKLILRTELKDYTLTFKESEFEDINNVSAGELAGSINSQQRDIFAEVVINRITKTKHLKIYSPTYGTEAYIRVIGGSSQKHIQFPSVVNVEHTISTTWEVNPVGDQSNSREFKISYVSGDKPKIENLNIGDIVILSDLEQEDLNGSYEILDVGLDSSTNGYFVIRNEKFIPDSFPFTLTVADKNNILFQSQKKYRIYDNLTYVAINEPDIREVDVSVPPVPPITRESLKGTGHIINKPLNIISFDNTGIVVEKPDYFTLPDSGKFTLSTKYKEDNKIYSYTEVEDLGSTLNLSTTNVFPPLSPSVIKNMIVTKYDDLVLIETEETHNLSLFNSVELTDIVFPTSNAIIAEPLTGLTTLNGTFPIERVISPTKFTIRIGTNYLGTKIQIQEMHTYKTIRNGYDIKIVFSTEDDRLLSKLKVKDSFTVSPTSVTVLDVQAYNYYKNQGFEVIKIEENIVYCKAIKKPFKDTQMLGLSFIKTDTYSFASGNFQVSDTDEYLEDLKLLVQSNVSSERKATYSYDTQGLYQKYVTSNISTTFLTVSSVGEEAIYKDNTYKTLIVEDSSDFPAEGYIVINHGSDKVEGPISYYANDGTNLYIDPNHLFKKNHYKGSEIRYLRSEKKVQLSNVGDEYQAYLTDTINVKKLLSDTLLNVSTAGTITDVSVRFPKLKYSEKAINPFISPKEQ